MGIWEDHLLRLNTPWRPIVDQYREGTVKRTPVRGVKESLKPHAYNRWEGYARVPGNPGPGMPDRVPFAEWAGELLCAARLSRIRGGAVAKASPNRALSRVE